LASTCSESANELLRQCLAGERWDADVIRALGTDECSQALFRIVVEGLADRFEPRLCDEYAAIFSLVIESVLPAFRAADLYARYQRVREPRICKFEPRRVIVLSRVTLGADIAITSILLDAARKRFPRADLFLAGSAKAAELFADADWIGHIDAPYPRSGSLHDRLASREQLAKIVDDEATLVIDPDSRLTQLGLLPVCAEDRYLFFESRSYGGDSAANLGELTQRWAQETLEVETASNLIFPPVDEIVPSHTCAVSLGTGGNATKQMPPEFEAELIRFLCSRFRGVLVDQGGGDEESERVKRATHGTRARTWQGSFARFASLIALSDCYVGYDSAGQHAAAASARPLVTLFKGFVSDRMFARWQPFGWGPKRVLRVENTVTVPEVAQALDLLFSSRL
jgi:ADP-heptose:LPS heptosyltransferase